MMIEKGPSQTASLLESNGAIEAKAVADFLKSLSANAPGNSSAYLILCLRQLIRWSELAIGELEKGELEGRSNTESEGVSEGSHAKAKPTTDHLPEFLTVPEFAAIVRSGKATVYEGVRTGRVRSVRMGRRVLIPRTEVERLIQDERQP